VKSLRNMRGLFCLLSVLFESFPKVLLACCCNFLNLKMKVENMIVKSVSVTMVLSILILASCSKNNEVLNSTDVENVNSELLSEAFVAETSEMSFILLSNINDSKLGSPSSSIPDLSSIDSPLIGAAIAISGTGGMNNPQGTITIDFKTGTTDHHGVLRKGIVKITYLGRRWAAGSTHAISFSGYSRNKVMISDSTTYTITNLTADSTDVTRDFHHVLKRCQLTFPDQKTFKRNAEFIASIDFVSKTTSLKAIDATNSAEGTTRFGANFVTNITDSLFYKSQCIGSKIFLPSEGAKTITIGPSTYTIAYGGAKTCGQTVTVKVGDKSATIAVNSDGN